MASLSDLFRLLDDVEDYLTGGFRRDRPMGRDRVEGGDHPEGSAAQDTPAGEASEDPADRASRLRRLAELAAEVAACTKCGLCRGRTHGVPGEGAIDPLVMVVGEGPGADEDATGRPFVGKAGQYLDKWLEAVQLARSTNAYIANIVKCRPPGNRDPLPDEMAACRPYLDRQIDLVRPRVILTVGRISSANLTGLEVGITKLRGSTYRYRGVPLIPTYHPSGVLRNPDYRAPVWDDLRRLKKHLDEPLS